MIVVLDSSGSVEETFRREKELAAGILSRFRIGPNNARVSGHQPFAHSVARPFDL